MEYNAGKNLTPLYVRKKLYYQAPVPERPISSIPGLKILFHFLYLPSYALLRKTRPRFLKGRLALIQD